MVNLNIYFFVKKIGSTTNAEHEESNILTIQDKNRTKILDWSLKKEKNNKKDCRGVLYFSTQKKHFICKKQEKCFMIFILKNLICKDKRTKKATLKSLHT